MLHLLQTVPEPQGPGLICPVLGLAESVAILLLASIKVAGGVGGIGNCVVGVNTYSGGINGLGPAEVAAKSQDPL